MQFTITSEYTKMRLDKFLMEHFPGFSRGHLQKLVKAGQITVGGKPVTPHHFLKAGDAVEATIEPAQELVVVPNPAVQVEVLSEEPDFIIVNKPAGLVVHQGAGHKTPDTLANGLLARYPEIGKVGDDPIRPGIMHRLDADVSGVMVIARTQDMFDALKRQFKLHEIEKEYVAVVQGPVSPSSGVIEFAIAHKGSKMVARPKGGEGRKAVTEYETIRGHIGLSPAGHIGLSPAAGLSPKSAAGLSPKSGLTVLRIATRTGRTHQIRVHLKALGNPIVGDRLYGKKSGQQDSRTAGRLMLHARRLAFRDLKNERREFVCEPAEKFLS